MCAHLRTHCVHIKGLRDVHIREHNNVRIKAHNVCTTRSAQYINVQQNVRYTLHLCTRPACYRHFKAGTLIGRKPANQWAEFQCVIPYFILCPTLHKC